MLKIKNWEKHQHFKDRRPPWIKLYRDILDDIQWHELDPLAAKTLVSLWLIASEGDGSLPDVKTLAFRLRISEKIMESTLTKLKHWLEQDDIKVISDGYQAVPLETETETYKQERETEKEMAFQAENDFQVFWDNYPRKVKKPDALKSWRKLKPPLDMILEAVAWQKLSDDWTADDGKFIPYPASYLNASRWLDEPLEKQRKSQTVQEARLDVARQIMGGSNGNNRQIRDITPAKSIESHRKSIPEIIDGIWEPDAS